MGKGKQLALIGAAVRLGQRAAENILLTLGAAYLIFHSVPAIVIGVVIGAGVAALTGVYVTLLDDIRRFFDAERMDGHVLGFEIDYRVDALRKARISLAGKSGDKVGIDTFYDNKLSLMLHMK